MPIYFIFWGILVYLHVEQLDRDPRIGLSCLETRSIGRQLDCHSIFRLHKLFMMTCVLWFGKTKTWFSYWPLDMILRTWFLFSDRKRPSAHNGSKWYKDMVTSVWGTHEITFLLMPTYSVDYNFNMGGVDRHDQMRSYSPTQLIRVRTWLLLFFFLLDAAIINAFVISRNVFGHTKIPHLTQQRAFRMRLAWNLVIIGARELDEDWTRIFETGQPVQSKGKFQTGVTPSGNKNIIATARLCGKALFPSINTPKPGWS